MPQYIRATCDGCSKKLSIEHTLSSQVQGERTRAGGRQKIGAADGGANTVGESQGRNERTVNGAVRLVWKPGQIVVPAESRAEVSANEF